MVASIPSKLYLLTDSSDTVLAARIWCIFKGTAMTQGQSQLPGGTCGSFQDLISTCFLLHPLPSSLLHVDTGLGPDRPLGNEA